MSRLIWSPAALQDVRRLHQFLAEKNADAAKRAVKAIRDGVKIIAQQPGVGRPAEDMELEYREWLIDLGDSGYVTLSPTGKRRSSWQCGTNGKPDLKTESPHLRQP